ncbi:hypothetical protein ACH4OV_29430 [Streptomyces diastaticus]
MAPYTLLAPPIFRQLTTARTFWPHFGVSVWIFEPFVTDIWVTM